jgi:hypothetical protein
MFNIFRTKKEKEYIKELKSEVNTHPVFDERDKEILNPIYDKELDKLNKKKAPFGIRIMKKMF